MEKALVIKQYNIAKPEEMQTMAKVLKEYIVKNNLYVQIVGKNYVEVEGWQFAGGLMGLFPRVVKVENVSKGDKEYKWLAQVEIFNNADGTIVGTGFAVCSNQEGKKKTFDEYAVLSMAQTRAIGKAYRNLIGWVMKLAGYEPTPAEDMPKTGAVVANSGATARVQAKVVSQGVQDAKTDYIANLRAEVRKKIGGQATETQIIAHINQKLGTKVTGFNSQKHAQVLLAQLLTKK
jgi:hypothetical protein